MLRQCSELAQWCVYIAHTLGFGSSRSGAGLGRIPQELAMTQRMSQTLPDFGRGFASMARQYHLDVEGENFYIDLLPVHVPTNRFVVVEIKAG